MALEFVSTTWFTWLAAILLLVCGLAHAVDAVAKRVGSQGKMIVGWASVIVAALWIWSMFA